MGVCGKESHLALRVTAVGAMCVGLDEFPDGETVRGFFGRDGDVLAHEVGSWFDWLRKCSYPGMARGSRDAPISCELCCSVLSARKRCTRWTAIAPSPTADATRLTLPARVSPTANIPGTLFSSRSGERLNGHWKFLYPTRSGPVTTNPFLSRTMESSSHSVRGAAPAITNTWRIGMVTSSPEEPSFQAMLSRCTVPVTATI